MPDPVPQIPPAVSTSAPIINQPQINQMEQLPKKPTSVFVFIFTSLISLVIGGSLVYAYYFFSEKKPTSQPSFISSQANMTPPELESSLPINISDPSVYSATLNYDLVTKIKGIQSISSNSSNLITSLNETYTKLPLLSVTSATPIFFKRNDQFFKGQVSDLKIDQDIQVYLVRKLKKGLWEVGQIQILSASPEATGSSIPAANP